MKTFSIYGIFSLCLLPLLCGQAPENVSSSGVVFIAAKQGPTQFLDVQGKVLPAAKSSVGAKLAEGYVAQAGIGGKIILLLSNGTVMTLDSQTKLKIREFTQEPFDAAGRKVSDLAEEPSKSNVKLDLDWGSIVVATKKLNRESRLDIHSPTGVAGIRGTQFQMSQTPGTGVKLDVSESTVAFTPPGGGQTVPVGAGQGLDVSAAGAVTPRPISPVAAQNITVTNTAAVAATGDVSLSAVSDAMATATSEGGDADADGGGDDGGDSSAAGDSDSSGESDNGGSGDTGNGDSAGGQTKGGGDSAGPSAAASPPNAPEVDSSQVLENNSDATQSRKTGKVSTESKKISQLGLTDAQAEILYSFEASLQSALATTGEKTAKRLIDLTSKGVVQSNLSTFFSYSFETRNKMLALVDDSSLANLLIKEYKESWLAGILTDGNLIALNTEATPQAPSVSPNAEAFLTLANKLRESGNSKVLDELLELGGGELTDSLLLEGEIANRLLGSVSSTGYLDRTGLATGSDAMSNRFYEDVSSLYQALLQDSLVAGEATFLGGRTISLAGGDYILNDLSLGNSDSLVFGATEQLTLQGSILFSGNAGTASRVVLMSGDGLQGSSDLTLDAATNDLVLSVRRDIILQGATAELPVVLRGNREVSLHAMRDVNLKNIDVSASHQAKIKAAKELYVDNMRFNAELPKIVMEATTIRLSNITFPANAAVNLNSLKGAIDGRYPNFGTSIPAAQQLGRVNFLQNVKSGVNLMHDRPSFDAHGGKITIGKLR